MKVAELEKGMLLEATAGVRLVTQDSTFGPDIKMVQATYVPARKGKWRRREVKRIMYLGTRDDVGQERTYWGNRYALVDGEVALIDRESWKYLKPVKMKSRNS